MDVTKVGQGPALVVAVHGIQGTRSVWMPVAYASEEVATFVLPNLRGRGGAARGASVDDYRLQDFGDDLAEVVESIVGQRRYWLAGWSMGVSVALEYLSRSNAQMPAGVILLSGTPAIREVRWFAADDGEPLLQEIAERETRLNLREAADHGAVAWTWQAIRNTDQRASLGRLDIPALVLHGCDDTDCPGPCASSLAHGIAGAGLQMAVGAGHNLPVTHSQLVANAIRGFLTRVPLSGKPT